MQDSLHVEPIGLHPALDYVRPATYEQQLTRKLDVNYIGGTIQRGKSSCTRLTDRLGRNKGRRILVRWRK